MICGGPTFTDSGGATRCMDFAPSGVRAGDDLRPLPGCAACGDERESWCCGCADHPIGKPWGWNSEAWETHFDEHHPLPPQPVGAQYRDEDFG